MNTCYICKNIETEQINQICDICINKYTVTNINNDQVNVKFVNGYICYYINDDTVYNQQLLINNIPVRPYYIVDKIVYIKK